MKEPPVVGEADKLRALTEDPELRTLMGKHYADGESEASLWAFIEKADAAFPDWQATIDRSRRDGDMLRATVIHCVKAVGKRGDLTETDRLIATKDEADFKTLFSKARRYGFLGQEEAFRLAELARDIAILAGLSREEQERLRKRTLIDWASKAGSAPKRKLWEAQATELGLEICAGDPAPSHERAAKDILNKWPSLEPGRPPQPRPPNIRTLAAFIAKERAAKRLPGVGRPRRGGRPPRR
jgi:hypothetical protein